MDGINRLSDATTAAMQASLLAVTIEDLCRILFRHALQRCEAIFGSASGKIDISVDYELWTVAVMIEADLSNIRSLSLKADHLVIDDKELKSISYLGPVQTITSSSSESTSCIWQNGERFQSQSSVAPLDTPASSIATAPGRGITASMRGVFSGMPVRRKLIENEATRRRQTTSLVHCIRELSLVAPHSSIRLNVRHAALPDGPAPLSKVLLSLPRATDLVHRCRTALGDESIQPDTVRQIAAEQTFASFRITIDGFAGLAATGNASTQVISLQGSVWPGCTVSGTSQASERESAVFALLLSTFGLPWTDEIFNRRARPMALSAELYERVCQRIRGWAVPDSKAHCSPAFVLNITLHSICEGRGVEATPRREAVSTVECFEAAILDAIGTKPDAAHVSRKRNRVDRPRTAGEGESKRKVPLPVKTRPATASLATESFGPAAAAPEGTVEWRHPVNGRLFHIDQRTGHSTAVGLASAGSAVVDRTKLNRGVDLSICTQRVRDDAASPDEFDDASLDAALASIPSPSPAATSDNLRRSRFFDTRRQSKSPLTLTQHRSLPKADADVRDTPAKANNLELAITRSDLQKAQVLDQVDGKFILCSAVSRCTSDPVLFCIDQHAADERYRLERLLEQYVGDCAAGTAAHVLPATLTLPISLQQYELIKTNSALEFGMKRLGWSIESTVLIHATLGHAQVDLMGVPHILKGKAFTDRGRVKDLPLLQATFTDSLHTLATPNPLSNHTIDTDWLALFRWIPSSLLEVLKSTACRSAIMFNDQLSKGMCRKVVERLGGCKFPFGCAHGRPSIVPLCEVVLQQK